LSDYLKVIVMEESWPIFTFMRQLLLMNIDIKLPWILPAAIDRLCGPAGYMVHFVKTSALNFYSTVHWAKAYGQFIELLKVDIVCQWTALRLCVRELSRGYAK